VAGLSARWFLRRPHVTWKRDVSLYRQPAGTSEWCTSSLALGDTYRAAGNGGAQSKKFHLQAGAGGSAELAYEPPSQAGPRTGVDPGTFVSSVRRPESGGVSSAERAWSGLVATLPVLAGVF
jgi:hypothetical protein